MEIETPGQQYLILSFLEMHVSFDRDITAHTMSTPEIDLTAACTTSRSVAVTSHISLMDRGGSGKLYSCIRHNLFCKPKCNRPTILKVLVAGSLKFMYPQSCGMCVSCV